MGRSCRDGGAELAVVRDCAARRDPANAAAAGRFRAAADGRFCSPGGIFAVSDAGLKKFSNLVYFSDFGASPMFGAEREKARVRDHTRGLLAPPAVRISNRLRIAAVSVGEWREPPSRTRLDFRELSFLKPMHAEATYSEFADAAPLQKPKSAARLCRSSRIVATK